MANVIPNPLGFASVRYIEKNVSDIFSPLSAISFGALLYAYDGPVSYITEFADEATLKNVFSSPDNINSTEWWNIAKVFDYKAGGIGGTAKAVRVVGTGTLNGVVEVTSAELMPAVDMTTQRIDNPDDALSATIVFDTDTLTTNAAKLKLFSKYPTAIARSVALCNSTDFATALITTGVTFLDKFDTAPGTNEIALAVLDTDGTILERHIVSLTTTSVDGFGNSNYIETINQKSKYILAYDNVAITLLPFSFVATAFTMGTIVAPVVGDYITALTLYDSVNTVDVNYILGNDKVIPEMITLCENRLDCQLIWSALLADVVGVSSITAVSNLVTYTSTTVNTDTTYGEFHGNAGLIYDTYAKKSRWIELAGDILGLRILKNLTGNQWDAAAGLNYGQLRNISKLAFNPSPSQGITLGRNKTSPIISKAGQGIVSWGIANYTSKKSALSDSTVRGLLIDIWRASKLFLEYKLFEINDDITRTDLKSKMDQFLEGVQAARGLNSFLTVCDTTNNTPQIIDLGQLVLEIRLIPTRIAKEIILLVKLANTGANLTVL